MPNKFKGEGELKAGAETFRVRLNFNVIIDIEDRLDKSIIEVFQTIQQGANAPKVVKLVRMVFWCMVRDAHPEVTESLAGDIMWRAGLPNVLQCVNDVAESAMPVMTGQAGGDADPDSPRTPGGTGQA